MRDLLQRMKPTLGTIIGSRIYGWTGNGPYPKQTKSHHINGIYTLNPAPNLTLLAIVSCWEGDPVLSSSAVPGKLTILQWKMTHPRILCSI